MLLALVISSLLGDVAPGPLLRRPPAQCAADVECVLSTYQGCCGGCCATAPHAVPRGTDETRRCANIVCAMPDCSAVRCAQPPDQTSFVAVCRSGQCLAVQKVTAPPECRVDTDCSLVTAAPPMSANCHRSPCGCCPVTQAVPADGAVPLQKRAPETGKARSKPDFGLSTGGPPVPPPPSCSPCPSPSGGTALCQSGRCVLVDSPPRPRPPG